jgi:hypothetical protein
LRNTLFIIGGIGDFEQKMFKNAVKINLYFLTEPRKTWTLQATCAQTLDQNTGQPLQKMLSYSCSTTLIFKSFEFSWTISSSGRSNRVKRNAHRRRHVALCTRALERARTSPRGATAPSVSAPSQFAPLRACGPQQSPPQLNSGESSLDSGVPTSGRTLRTQLQGVLSSQGLMWKVRTYL